MKKYILFPALIALLGTLVSCSGKLYSDPADRITEDQIIELNKTNPDAVLKSVANNIEMYPKNRATTTVFQSTMRVGLVGMDYKGNDMVHLNPGGWLYGDYQMLNYRLQTNSNPEFFWRWMYQFVYKGNQLLSLIPDMEEVTNEDVKKKLQIYKACGLTLRAWGYLYLMWLFQDDYLHGGNAKAGVPLYLEPDLPAAGRAPAEEVWGWILADAKEAVALFNAGGRDPKASQQDFDATVANMILARAALTVGDWGAVISATEAVITAYPTLMNESDYTTKGFGWLEKVDEIIYGFDYDQTIGGTSSFHGWMNILGNGGYGGSQGNWNAIDNRLYDQIDDNDYRKDNFLAAPMSHLYDKEDAPRTLPKYASLKFAAPAHGTNTNCEQAEIFLRTSEAILMKAEAQARSGQDGPAKTTLNTLLAARTKAGQPTLTCDNYASMSGMSALEMVQLQTRIELWGEGFEFLNNKRWNIGVDRTSSSNHGVKVVIEPGQNMTFQIPLNTEMVYNPNITSADQNP